MAKPSEPLLVKAATLLETLLDEANKGGEGGPDFADRLKVLDVSTKFLVVKNKLAPPTALASAFEELKDELHGGSLGSRTRAAAKGKGRANGAAVATAFDDL